MKLPLFIFVFCGISSCSSSQSRVEIGEFGFGFSGEKFFPTVELLSITPGFTYYLPVNEAGIQAQYWELNGDLHVYFSKKDTKGIYALMGVNYINLTVRGGTFSTGSDTTSEVGLNLGLGGSVGSPYCEMKFETMAEGQFVLLLGFRF